LEDAGTVLGESAAVVWAIARIRNANSGSNWALKMASRVALLWDVRYGFMLALLSGC